MPKLTPKKQRFCEEYIVDYAAGAAAVRAGYTSSWPRNIGSRLLMQPEVAEMVDLLQREQSKRTGITADWVVANLRVVAERCLQAEPVKDNRGQPLLAAGADGEMAAVYKFDSAGANRALELLGKHLGVFAERKADNALTVQIVRYSQESE